MRVLFNRDLVMVSSYYPYLPPLSKYLRSTSCTRIRPSLDLCFTIQQPLARCASLDLHKLKQQKKESRFSGALPTFQVVEGQVQPAGSCISGRAAQNISIIGESSIIQR